MNEAYIWQYIFLGEIGGRGLKQFRNNIRRGGYLMIMLDYRGGSGVENLGKTDVISKCS